MWLDWLIFCDCGFQSVCPLMEKDKRFMEASWWMRLTERETTNIQKIPWWLRWENLPAMQENQLQPLGWEDVLQKGIPTPPIFLLGEFHGQGSLTDYSPWGHKELDTTEELIVSLPPPFFRNLHNLCSKCGNASTPVFNIKAFTELPTLTCFFPWFKDLTLTFVTNFCLLNSHQKSYFLCIILSF